MKLQSPTAAMRQLWSQRGTTAAVALVDRERRRADQELDAASARATSRSRRRAMKLDGAVVDKYITKKLSCGDCPMPCKGIVKVKSRGLTDVRRPDYETIVGFGANLLNDDIELVTACHDACNRYGIDAVSSSTTLGWVCEAVEKGMLDRGRPRRHRHALGQRRGRARAHDQDGHRRRLRRVARPRRPARRRARRQGQRRVRGPRPRRRARVPRHALHLADGRDLHRRPDARPPHRRLRVVERDVRRRASRCPTAADKKDWNVKWKGTEGKGKAQALHSNAHQAMNGLGLCMFTMLTGALPWTELVNARDRLGRHRRGSARRAASASRTCAPRSTAARASGPPDFEPHPRMLGEGDGNLHGRPAQGRARAAAGAARRLLHARCSGTPTTGNARRARAPSELGMAELLAGYVE